MVNLQILSSILPNVAFIILENAYSCSIILLLTIISVFIPNKQVKTLLVG